MYYIKYLLSTIQENERYYIYLPMLKYVGNGTTICERLCKRLQNGSTISISVMVMVALLVLRQLSNLIYTLSRANGVVSFFSHFVSAAVFFAVTHICGVAAAPTGRNHSTPTHGSYGSSIKGTLSSSSDSSSSPHWVLYGDQLVDGVDGVPDPSVVKVGL